MGFDQGRIILDSDNGIYYAGQMVYGKLVFDEDRPKPVRGLYVKMKGYCDVHWTTTHQRRGSERNESYIVNHNAHEVYLELKQYLVGGETGEYQLSAGRHEFPFQFQIPFNCPSSYEGSFGHIRFEIKVVVDQTFKLNQEKKAVFKVIAPYDLNADPYCREPIQFAMYKSYCSWCVDSGSSETIVKLPAAGFCPGQEVPIEIGCTNNSSVDIKTIKLSMIKNIIYRTSSDNETKKEEFKIAEIVKGPVAGNASRNWAFDFKVPEVDTCNLASCRYIDIDFEFKVTVEPEGLHTSNEESTRIVLGNIPLAGFENKCTSLRGLMPNVPIPVSGSYNPTPNVVSQVPTIATINQPLNTGYPHPGVTPCPVPNPPYPGSGPGYPGANPYPSNLSYPTGNPPNHVNPPYGVPYPTEGPIISNPPYNPDVPK